MKHKSKPNKSQLQAYHMQAVIAFEQRQYLAVVNFIEPMLDSIVNSGEGRLIAYELAWSYVMLGKYNSAAELLEMLISISNWDKVNYRIQLAGTACSRTNNREIVRSLLEGFGMDRGTWPDKTTSLQAWLTIQEGARNASEQALQALESEASLSDVTEQLVRFLATNNIAPAQVLRKLEQFAVQDPENQLVNELKLLVTG